MAKAPSHDTVILDKYYVDTMHSELDDLRKAADDILYHAMTLGYTYNCDNYTGAISSALLDQLYLARNIVDEG